jgi:hypothetical protein
LVVFGLSYLVRGSFDTFQHYYQVVDNPVFFFVMLIVIYFFCEWLPIAVIYIHHRQDFYHEQ